MKNLQGYFFALMMVMMVMMSSCDLIGGIFKAGMWTALILIILVVLLVVWLFRKIRR
ncbi:hypothetical protein [Rufibacter roseus]|uniref:Phosphatidate cytidylyltransferase n=1 Tax=Rufibacter roseus TaxID=1567108 RepID=A0ABW2DK23_9BACT|nr:hypothetical protein [Rufibacter roseus]